MQYVPDLMRELFGDALGIGSNVTKGFYEGTRSIARNIPKYAMKYVSYPVAGFVLGVAVLGGVACGSKNDDYVNGQSSVVATYTPVPTATPMQARPAIEVPYEQAREYFSQVAFGAEFGQTSDRIWKWNSQPIRIFVNGSPRESDIAVLEDVISDLRELTKLDISVTTQQWSQNVNIYFVPRSEFKGIEPKYIEGNAGFFRSFGFNYILSGCNILIDSTLNNQFRPHYIREETTQCLTGLFNDTDNDQSIFSQNPRVDINHYTALDRSVIQLMFSDAIKAGMDEKQALASLDNLFLEKIN